jgi:hypothetical protein
MAVNVDTGRLYRGQPLTGLGWILRLVPRRLHLRLFIGSPFRAVTNTATSSFSARKPYSYLKAIMGSTFVARRAGI